MFLKPAIVFIRWPWWTEGQRSGRAKTQTPSSTAGRLTWTWRTWERSRAAHKLVSVSDCITRSFFSHMLWQSADRHTHDILDIKTFLRTGPYRLCDISPLVPSEDMNLWQITHTFTVWLISTGGRPSLAFRKPTKVHLMGTAFQLQI